MDEKKVREAIKLIKQEIQILEDLGNYGGIIEEKIKKHIELYNTVIEALEKQLPKKPKHIHTKYRKHSWKKKVDGSIDMEAFDGDIHGCAAECERCGRLAFYENLLESDGCEMDEYFCQSCNRKVKKYDKSCDCGQKIDWSE